VFHSTHISVSLYPLISDVTEMHGRLWLCSSSYRDDLSLSPSLHYVDTHSQTWHVESDSLNSHYNKISDTILLLLAQKGYNIYSICASTLALSSAMLITYFLLCIWHTYCHLWSVWLCHIYPDSLINVTISGNILFKFYMCFFLIFSKTSHSVKGVSEILS